MNNFAIKLLNITKEYTIHHEKPTLVEKIVRHKNESFFALKNVNLEIKPGEKVGIIGENGSGKTTLLKIISRIANPTSGSVTTKGNIVSLIDLEAGFHPDLTGEQNIFLNGMLLGMRKVEIAKVLKHIIKVANIGRFIDIPLFTYSQGMKLRLGFSIAIHANPDILILDETMSVGDKRFRKTSHAKIQEIISNNKTVIIASHDLKFIGENCERVIWIKKGLVVADNRTRKVLAQYQN
jgi:ABC-type polysaccharide/polyol phosphate transport system ATPase subunit